MSFPKFPIFKILILVTILAVPGFLYYLLQAKGKNRYKPLPIYGPKEVAATFTTKRGKKIPDTIYHQIPNVKFISSTGDSLDFSDYKTELLIVNFFYSRNGSPLNEMNQTMRGIKEEFKDNKLVRFISISVDPDFDKPKVLRSYAKQLNTGLTRWNLLTADTAIVYPLARNSFFVNAFKGTNGETDYIFSDQLILLDVNHRIRGYYKATSTDEMKRLSDELKVMITEELRKIKAEA
jgi:protein SCO1/2